MDVPPPRGADAGASPAPGARLVQTLRDWRWTDTLRLLGRRFREERLGLTAGSLTFTTLIALVPLVTVTLAVFTVFPMFSSFQGALEKYFLQALVPDAIARPVLRTLTQFAAKASELGGFGLAFLVATAVALMSTIDRTLNAIWRVRRPRPWPQRLLVYWGALTLGPLAIGVSLWATSYALSASGGLVRALPGGVRLAINAAEFVLFTLALAALYHYVPNTHVRRAHALAGGLFGAAAFELAKALLAWYVGAVPTFAAVYGAFATLPILLLWIYLAWVVVLLGAVIAAYAPTLQQPLVLRPPAPGDRFEQALAALRALRDARAGARGGLTAAELAARLNADPLQTDETLARLAEFGWVGRLDEAPPPRHVLIADPARTPAAPLVDALLLRPGAGVRAFRERAGVAAMRLDELL